VLASIEYAAAHTGASLCLVLGHGDNELFRKVLQGKLDERPMTDSMRQLAQKLEPIVGRAKAEGGSQLQISERALTYQLQRFVTQARTRSDVLRGLEAKGTFAMLAATYDLESGDLTWVKTASPGAAPAGETHAAHGDATAHGAGRHDAGHATDPNGAGHDVGHDVGHDATHGDPSHASGDHAPHVGTSSGHDSIGDDAEGHGAGAHGNSDYELLASMADARAGGGGHGDGHGETAAADTSHTAKAAGSDTLTIILIMLTGVLAAAVGISLLLWMQRQRPEVELDDAAAE